MSEDRISHFDPIVLAKMENLQLRARTVVEGFIAGLHQSPFKGYSLEFAQHREYAIGDELKHLDWKVYGRTDRFFIKQFEEETNLRVYILLDASGSMGFKGSSSALSKYDYGATLAASLSYLTLRQGDSAGLGILKGQKVKMVPPRNSFSHLNNLLEELKNNQPEGETTLSKSLESVAHTMKKRSLIILISDLFDDVEDVMRSLKFLQFKKHELMVIHLLDRDEKDFPYTGSVRFDSMETQDHVLLDADAYKQDYQKAINHFIDQYKVMLRNHGVEYYFNTTNKPLDKMLQFVLGTRN